MMTSTELVLILGTGPMAAKVIDAIAWQERRFSLAGIVTDRRPSRAWPGSIWLGPADRLDEIVERLRPARIVVAMANRRGHLPVNGLLRWRMHGIEIEDAHDFYERVTGKMAIEALPPSTLILAKGFRDTPVLRVLTRAASMATAAVGLVLLAPLLALIVAAIKLDSDGPVFFVQPRAGKGGRPFPLLKFRTMHPVTTSTSEWARDNSERITRAGRWLRRFRLDELPQLVNVLRGDMNLIGPRPHPVSNHALFMRHIAYYELRSSVRPGVTGWAQVRYGYANNLEEETEKMRYDLYYIKNRSIGLDLRILAETFATVLFGCRAATPAHTRHADRSPVDEDAHSRPSDDLEVCA